MTSYALMAYSWGMLAMGLVKVLAPGYFARQDMRTPVRIGMIALGVNVGLNIALVLPAAHMGFPAPHALLAVSTSVSAALNTYLLWRGLRRSGVYTPAPGWGKLLAQVLAANAVMAGCLLWIAGDLGSWIAAGTLERTLRCAMCIVAGAGAYFASLFLFGARYRDLAGTRRESPL